MTFENTGLPDKKAYRKAYDSFQKAFADQQVILEIYLSARVAPAKLLCALKLPESTEKKLVTLMLDRPSVFNLIASRRLRKLQDALHLGYCVWGESTDVFKQKSADMTPEERLMCQMGIYSTLLQSVHVVQALQSPDATTHAYEDTKLLMKAYYEVSRGDFPLVDQQVKKTHEALGAPARKCVPSSPQP